MRDQFVQKTESEISSKVLDALEILQTLQSTFFENCGFKRFLLYFFLKIHYRRGTFFAIFTSGPQLAFVFGPVMGGIIVSVSFQAEYVRSFVA
jgi:hypothetical protein